MELSNLWNLVPRAECAAHAVVAATEALCHEVGARWGWCAGVRRADLLAVVALVDVARAAVVADRGGHALEDERARAVRAGVAAAADAAVVAHDGAVGGAELTRHIVLAGRMEVVWRCQRRRRRCIALTCRSRAAGR